MSQQEDLKKQAALRAVTLVASGMTVGLGTGSTATHFVAELGRRLAAGELARVAGVPTSRATARQATALGIPLVEVPTAGVDLAVDGMDEYDDDLDAIKGLGGALLREKIVAASAATFVLIGDSSKHVKRLGEKAPLPVEVATFGWQRTAAALAGLGAVPALRRGGDQPFVTDNGNYVLDCRFPGGLEPKAVARALCDVPGVLGHGLFLGIARQAFVATEDGVVELTSGAAR